MYTTITCIMSYNYVFGFHTISCFHKSNQIKMSIAIAEQRFIGCIKSAGSIPICMTIYKLHILTHFKMFLSSICLL